MDANGPSSQTLAHIYTVLCQHPKSHSGGDRYTPCSPSLIIVGKQVNKQNGTMGRGQNMQVKDR